MTTPFFNRVKPGMLANVTPMTRSSGPNSEGGMAYVQSQTHDNLWKVKYSMNNMEEEVAADRIIEASLDQVLPTRLAKRKADEALESTNKPTAAPSTVFDNLTDTGSTELTKLLVKGRNKEKGFRRSQLWKRHHHTEPMPK